MILFTNNLVVSEVETTKEALALQGFERNTLWKYVILIRFSERESIFVGGNEEGVAAERIILPPAASL